MLEEHFNGYVKVAIRILEEKMMFDNAIAKLESVEVASYPFQHFVIENLLDSSLMDLLHTDLDLLEKGEPDKVFVSPFGSKREWRTFPKNLVCLSEWMGFLYSEPFIESLRKSFSIPNDVSIFPDFSYDGGGYVVSPPKSFLGYHADFNFSSKVDKYRSLNVLFYMNRNYQENFGGHLHLLDSESKTVEGKVLPNANTILAFKTDDESFHGVSRNSAKFNRRSFNIYYYTDKPISSKQSEMPHKTLWLDIDLHDH